MGLIVLATAVAALALPAAAQTVSVKGPTGAVTLSAADVAALPRVGFLFDAHGRAGRKCLRTSESGH